MIKNKIYKNLFWIAVAVVGAFAFGGLALHRGESINALWLIVAALCIYAIGYRFILRVTADKQNSTDFVKQVAEKVNIKKLSKM